VPTALCQSNQLFRPLYLSGRVVLEDGSPPPAPALVELRCADQRQPQYYTDKKGYFNFRVGGEPSRSVADSQRTTPGQAVGASGSDRSFVSLTNCELEAALAGYLSSKIFLGRRSVFESSDVGTIVLRPVGKGVGSFVSLNTLAAPEAAKKAFEQAEKELQKEKPNSKKAVKDLEKATGEYPQFAAAWHLLGKARLRENDANGARDAFEKAISTDPKYVVPLLSLALLELQMQRMAQASELAGRALKLVPGSGEANYYLAVAELSLGNMTTAETAIQAVHASNEAARYPRTHFMLGNILAQKGDVKTAASEFKKFLEVEPASRAAEAVKAQLAEWEAGGLLK
jgi:tetratricopeptide (TPR) repeat protein